MSEPYINRLEDKYGEEYFVFFEQGNFKHPLFILSRLETQKFVDKIDGTLNNIEEE
jgi:hypothetical protein